MMELIILVAVVSGIGFILGWHARELRARIYLRSVEERMMKAFRESIERAEKNVVEIDLNREGDVFYVYNKETGEFLAQGKTHDDISKVLSDRFPHLTFVARPTDLQKVGYEK